MTGERSCLPTSAKVSVDRSVAVAGPCEGVRSPFARMLPTLGGFGPAAPAPAAAFTPAGAGRRAGCTAFDSGSVLRELGALTQSWLPARPLSTPDRILDACRCMPRRHTLETDCAGTVTEARIGSAAASGTRRGTTSRSPSSLRSSTRAQGHAARNSRQAAQKPDPPGLRPAPTVVLIFSRASRRRAGHRNSPHGHRLDRSCPRQPLAARANARVRFVGSSDASSSRSTYVLIAGTATA